MKNRRIRIALLTATACSTLGLAACGTAPVGTLNDPAATTSSADPGTDTADDQTTDPGATPGVSRAESAEVVEDFHHRAATAQP